MTPMQGDLRNPAGGPFVIDTKCVELGRVAAKPPGQVIPVPAGATFVGIAFDVANDEFVAYGYFK